MNREKAVEKLKRAKIIILIGEIAFALIFSFLLFLPQKLSANDEEKIVQKKEVTKSDAIKFIGGVLAAAIAVGLGSIAAGKAVERVGSASIGAIVEKPELFGKTILYVGLAEGIAIYGVIVALLILFRI
jgi:V/A-type H+-transporting ATPase subunit K